MKMIIDWYSDGDALSREFVRREVISADHNPHEYLLAWMTVGKIWKNYTLRSVSKAQFEEELRKAPK